MSPQPGSGSRTPLNNIHTLSLTRGVLGMLFFGGRTGLDGLVLQPDGLELNSIELQIQSAKKQTFNFIFTWTFGCSKSPSELVRPRKNGIPSTAQALFVLNFGAKYEEPKNVASH